MSRRTREPRPVGCGFPELNRHNLTLEKTGLPRVSTYPAQARLKFGDRRMGDLRLAADITAGIAGARGNFAAFVLDADIPAFAHRGVGSSG